LFSVFRKSVSSCSIRVEPGRLKLRKVKKTEKTLKKQKTLRTEKAEKTLSRDGLALQN